MSVHPYPDRIAGSVIKLVARVVCENVADGDDETPEAVREMWRVMAVDARDEYDTLRADLARLTQERDEALADARGARAALEARIEKAPGELDAAYAEGRARAEKERDALRAVVEAAMALRLHEVSWCLTDPPCGTCDACRFRAALSTLDTGVMDAEGEGT